MQHLHMQHMTVCISPKAEHWFFLYQTQDGFTLFIDTPKKTIRVDKKTPTSKSSGLYTVSGSSMWPRCPGQLRKSWAHVAHASLLSEGPRARSYRPFTMGLPILSMYCGLVMAFTLSFLKEKRTESVISTLIYILAHITGRLIKRTCQYKNTESVIVTVSNVASCRSPISILYYIISKWSWTSDIGTPDLRWQVSFCLGFLLKHSCALPGK